MVRPELPSGTLTLLFTDIEGSTRLIDALGEDGYLRTLAEHRRLLRGAFAAHGGVEVDTEGDAFFYVFTSPAEALAGAAEGREALRSGPVRVRMGLHTGVLLPTGEGYAGRELHRAARIAAAAHGGQIIVSGATRALLDGDLVELGEHRLKDFDKPVLLFQLGRERFPPLKTLSNTNLPRPASSFVGRHREREDLVQLLRHRTRLATLTGPGGSGKTRLALEAASEVVSEFRAGVFWVPLASLRDPELVTETIAQAIGAKDGLAGHIGDRELLLVLDNFEQVIAAAPELSGLLEACQKLTLLVTSRELLRIRGEVEYPVPPLAAEDAVNLFCERSRLEPDATIREICRRLDDLPLAVELAAARTGVLSPDQILERLSQRLDLLKGGRDADARQQTLRATIEWSHELLDADEKRLFALLAVFRAGCALEAAETVCDADIDVLQSLVDKSLVRRTRDRFWMLETIREYAVEQFDALVGARGIRAAHAEYIAVLVERADPHLVAGQQQAWADRLSLEWDNIRAAMEFALADTPEIALRIVASLAFYPSLRGGIAEVRTWAEEALSAGADAPSPRRQRVLICAATMASWQGDVPASKQYADEAYAMAVSASDGFGITAALRERSKAAVLAGDRQGARAILEDLVRVADEVGDAFNGAIALNNLGDLALYDGDWARTIELCGRSATIRRGMGNLWGAALCLGNVAEAQRELGLFDDAARTLRQALDDSLAVGARMIVLNCFAIGAMLAADRERPEDAATLLGAHEQLNLELEVAPDDYEGHLLDALQEKTRALVGEAAYARAKAHGRSLLIEDAAELVRTASAP